MSKWFGKIGFALPVREIEPGVWDSPVEEKPSMQFLVYLV